MKKAKKIKDLKDYAGHASLYKLSEPMEFDEPWDENDPPAKKTKYVVVSAAIVMLTGPETYVFPATAKGDIKDWGELNGSYRGGLDHSKALGNAGYIITND